MNILVLQCNQEDLDAFCQMLRVIDTAVPLPLTDTGVALTVCRSIMPDLVMVDYNMSEINGLEFLRRFRALPGAAAVPVIMLNADSKPSLGYEALRLGANDFLTKPVDQLELNARVGNLLALRRAQLQLQERADWLSLAVQRSTAALIAREHEVIHRLSRVAEFRDTATGNHLLRMAAYARVVAEQMGLPQAECDLIWDAAPMHDIGKVGIPDGVLLKPGPLDPLETAVMRTHPQIGHDILAGSDSLLLQAGAAIAISHHERYDGAGYPRNLAGEDIPLYGRIVAVADVFDVLTSASSAEGGWELSRAVDFMREGSGSHFDPRCVRALLDGIDGVAAVQRQYRQGNMLPARRPACR